MTDKIAIDELADDVFGLNVRGLRSIATIWIAPRRYFDAAAAADWFGRYTPSIRLWVSLIAVYSLLQFLWIGVDTSVVALYAEGFRDEGIRPPEGMSLDELGEQAASWVFAMMPFFQLVLYLLFLSLFPFWGEPTTYALRVRRVFGVIIPSASLLVVLLPVLRVIPSDQLTNFGYAIAVMAFLLDAVTGYRGTFSAVSGFARLWRAALLAFVILVLSVLANVGATIAGIILISVQYGLSPG